MEKKQLFIKTQDKNVAEELLAAGYNLLNKTGNVWTFQNNKNQKFAFENKSVAYSDILTF